MYPWRNTWQSLWGSEEKIFDFKESVNWDGWEHSWLMGEWWMVIYKEERDFIPWWPFVTKRATKRKRD